MVSVSVFLFLLCSSFSGKGFGISSHHAYQDDPAAGDDEGTNSWDILNQKISDSKSLGDGVEVNLSSVAEEHEHSDSLFDSDYNMGYESIDDDELFENHVDQGEGEEQRVVRIEHESDSSESGEEDLIDNSIDFDEHRVSDDGDEGSSQPAFNPALIFDPDFELGMEFGTKQEFKKAVQSHAIKSKRTLKFIKNDKIRVYVRCAGEDCNWRINALKVNNEQTFQIREYNPNYSCPQTFHVKNVKTDWLSEKYIQKFQSDPKRNVKGFRFDVINEIRCHVSKHQAYRVKRKALSMIEGNPDLQYTKLWDYAEELRKTNPGSTIILGIEQQDGEERFSRFYVCFDALKRGFLSGCRPLIGVDGCHLKGPHGGVLLTAVGVDPNNNIYPIAYSIVCKECRETWEWFLILLKKDLNIVRHHEYTFMSDKQKGLIQVFQEVFPDSDHRFCVRHLHNNFKNAGYRSLAFKNALWRAAQATTVGEFNVRMREMRALNESAANWLSDKPAAHWSRSHFSVAPKCDMLLNNICETFNSNILDARGKPIITMLEWIREYLMKRLQENRDRAEMKWKGKLCPKIKKIIDKHVEKLPDCRPIKADDMHYQISCYDGTQYSVDLGNHSCTCRMWELSGIPCKHACSGICNQHELPEDYVHRYYSVDTYKLVYAPAIMQLSCDQIWGETMYIPPLPPNFGRSVGRPCRARRREPDEPIVKQKKRSKGRVALRMKKQKYTVKCRNCGTQGHNSTTCPQVNEETNVVTEGIFDEPNVLVQPRPKLKVRKRSVASNQPGASTNISRNNESGQTREFMPPRPVVEMTVQTPPPPPPPAKPSILPPIVGDYDLGNEAAEVGVSMSQASSSIYQDVKPKVPGPSMYEQWQMTRSSIMEDGGQKYLDLSTLSQPSQGSIMTKKGKRKVK